jgi:hypothetical protein
LIVRRRSPVFTRIDDAMLATPDVACGAYIGVAGVE